MIGNNRHNLTPWVLFKEGQELRFRPPFGGMMEMLEYWEKKQPERMAIEFVDVDSSKRLNFSYGKLKESVQAAAGMLEKKGLKPGDAVAFAYHNHANTLILSLAAWVSGIKTVPLDLKRDDEEMMRYKLELSDSRIVFREDQEWDSNQESPGVARRLLDRQALDTEALVLFTSGTTAQPKGALLTQENLVANGDGIADWLDIKREDRFMILLPLHHINSTTMSLATLLRGGTIILLSRYSNSRFWELVARTKATITSVVPTIIHDQLGQRKSFLTRKRDIRLSRIQIGSAPVIPQEAEEFVRQTGIPLIQGYGQTETALRSTGVRWNPSHPLSPTYWRNLSRNSIGEEMKWTNVTVLRPDGSQAAAEEIGEICVRGPIIMKGYLKNLPATKEAFQFGWFHSGDLGYWEENSGEKQFFLSGRLKEIIIKAGVNVSPILVEQALKRSLTSIDQVYVIGISDERLGEEIAAVVVWKNPPVKFVKFRKLYNSLSEFESPQYWFSIKAGDLPMTSTGKVQRVKLKQMFSPCARLGETDTAVFRLINPLETMLIEQARQIHNQRWAPINVSVSKWQELTKKHLLLSAIDRLTGQIRGSVLIKSTARSLRCLAISSVGRSFPLPRTKKIPVVTPRDVHEYLRTEKDPVITFHQKAKGGLKSGAKIVSVLKSARPDDAASLGYGVLMRYPDVTKTAAAITISPDEKLGTQLIEAVLKYAQKCQLGRVEVLTRPARLLWWAIKRELV